MSIPLIDRLAPLGPRADAWLCDIWGVLHNGAAAFPDAVACLAAFKAGGGTTILVSNAPRPAASVATQLAALGIPASAYAAILTSGDVTHTALGAVGATPLLHIGPERDRALFADRAFVFVPADAAELIVCTGLYDDTREGPEDYRATLTALARRGVAMLCANPDIRVDRGGQIIYCAGAIAGLYEQLGGRVTYAGKPHPPIYTAALAKIAELRGAPVAAGRILAIGDGIATDIAGAHAAGIASVYVASAIHLGGPLDAGALDRLFGATSYRPLAAMPALVW